MEEKMLHNLLSQVDIFKKKTDAFYAGEISKKDYKSFSGYYGSYAQRGGTANMLRLRMPAGCVTREKLRFTAEMIRKYQVKRVHFTTCQTIQLHDLKPETVYVIMKQALEHDIVPIGGGGDYPRNVMCSPLSGVQTDEFFDVQPYALAASDYLLTLLGEKKMPRKLKVGFSNSPKNETHATFRDLGFAARPDQTFDVYAAGGLGSNPKLGVKVAEKVKPDQILYYIKAMWKLFLDYGNYDSHAKARTRYMQDTLGGPEGLKKTYSESLHAVYEEDEALTVSVSSAPISKKGDGSTVSGKRILSQKQEGLYTVVWHPIGGQPDPALLCSLSDVLSSIEAAQLRLGPDETAYVINLTGKEAEKIRDLLNDGAASLFETSISCIGASICQFGVRDSQALLHACIQAVRKAGIPDGALPQIHISGCPSSCSGHQMASLGFRGGAKKGKPAFAIFRNGSFQEGSEVMGIEAGTMLEAVIPEFLTALGNCVAQSGETYDTWILTHTDDFDRLVKEFMEKEEV